jgi:hypothetical protein
MMSPLAYIKKHSILFSRKLGKLPCKPVHLKLTNPNACQTISWLASCIKSHICSFPY